MVRSQENFVFFDGENGLVSDHLLLKEKSSRGEIFLTERLSQYLLGAILISVFCFTQSKNLRAVTGKAFENILGKGRNAGNQQFLFIFLAMFSDLSKTNIIIRKASYLSCADSAGRPWLNLFTNAINHLFTEYVKFDCVVFNAVFNNISIISRRPVHLSRLSGSSFNQYSAQYSFEATGCFPT